jgi:hypothetical protein
MSYSFWKQVDEKEPIRAVKSRRDAPAEPYEYTRLLDIAERLGAGVDALRGALRTLGVDRSALDDAIAAREELNRLRGRRAAA